ncbi:hypothetical protein E0H46_28630 [Rhizobium leguminosarum bv. viciae]|nr:hypothetical protein E0H46_28630 [Rhizobium leguminosarum bv. viciae]
MTRLHKTTRTVLSTMGLIIGGLLGYQLAGILGLVMFVPVGAIVGLCAGLMGWPLKHSPCANQTCHLPSRVSAVIRIGSASVGSMPSEQKQQGRHS